MKRFIDGEDRHQVTLIRSRHSPFWPKNADRYFSGTRISVRESDSRQHFDDFAKGRCFGGLSLLVKKAPGTR